MAFEENNFFVAKKLTLEKKEFNVECNILPGENVQKVLATAVDASLLNYEVYNGGINFSGNIDVKVVYLCDDGQINTVNSTCPFSSKFEGENIEAGQNAVLSIKVVDYNYENANNDNLKLNITLLQSGFVIYNKDVHAVDTHNPDICCKYEEISLPKFIACGEETFNEESETLLREKIKKIVLVQSKVVTKNVDAGVNFVSVSGELAVKVLYVNENEKIESGYIYDTFKEEVEMQGVGQDCLIEARTIVRQDGVTAEIVEDEKGCKLVIKTPLCVQVCAFGRENVSVIKDLYSTENELNVTTTSFAMTNISPMETVEGKIEGSLTLSEDSPRVDKIIMYGGDDVVITNNYTNDGEVFVEGIARTNVVYLNDEENALHSIQLDIPFTISNRTNFPEGGFLVVDAVLGDVDVSVRKGREILFDGKVKACVNQYFEETSAVISEANDGELYPEKDYSMEVVFVKGGSDLWEVAKYCKVKENQILMQNPDVVFPLADDTSLVLFYQKFN